MSKKISLGAAIAFMVIVATATVTMTWLFAQRAFDDTSYDLRNRQVMYDKLAEVDDYVRQNYLGTIDEDGLNNQMITGYLAGTGDAYAKYYDAAAYARLQQSYKDQQVQIGIVPKMDESGYIVVEEIYPDSPAQAAGLQPGDLIVRIDDTDVTAENYSDAVSMLYGDAGTKMNIVVRRGVEDSTLDNMTRRFVEVPSVYSSMLENQIGLVVIKEFADSTPDQFTKQVDKLIDDGAQGLVFDVRGVNSGTQNAVVEALDKLLPKGVILSTTDKAGNVGDWQYSDEREVALPMAVLVNERTSGEAELFAVAIRDYNKGKLIGAATAGKGTVQKPFPLKNGGAIEITTARYNPPTSPSYDGEGVRPDFEVKMAEDSAPGNLLTDPQLKKAAEAVVATIRMNETMENQQAASGAESAVEPAPSALPEAAYSSPDGPEPSAPVESSGAESSGAESSGAESSGAASEGGSQDAEPSGAASSDGQSSGAESASEESSGASLSEPEPLPEPVDLTEFSAAIDLLAGLTFGVPEPPAPPAPVVSQPPAEPEPPAQPEAESQPAESSAPESGAESQGTESGEESGAPQEGAQSQEGSSGGESSGEASSSSGVRLDGFANTRG